MSHILRLRMGFHTSCGLAVVLIVAILTTQFSEVFSLWQRMRLGFLGALLFFVGIGVREFVLMVLAARRRIPVKNLTLFAFGAVRHESAEITMPVLERLMAVAGMVTNIIVAGLFYAIFVVAVVTGDEVAAGLTQWLAYIFLLLAMLHFIPGWPLDAGRLFASYLWHYVGSYYRAIRIASWAGSAVGGAFVLGGIALITGGREWFSAALMILVGWAVFRGASLGRRQAAFHHALDGCLAGQISTTRCVSITPQQSLGELVRDHVLVSGQRYFPVVDDGRFLGVVTLRRLESVPRKRWESTNAGSIMLPAARIPMVNGSQSANSLLRQMDDAGLDELPVLEEDGTLGVVTRDMVIHLGETRVRLKAQRGTMP